MGIFNELQWRGLLSDYTGQSEDGEKQGDFPGLLDTQSVCLYAGFDPSADSLHIGHLVPLIGLRRFQEMGHTPIALAGGATGSIGDPSGKSAERNLLTSDQIRGNVEAIRPQLERLLDFECKTNPARLVNNADWFEPISFVDFLRDIGKYFSVNQMVARESVKARMEGAGISYTEFSYMLLQAYDFYHLNQEFDCTLQMGGSDQWGNIVAGIDLIRRKVSQPAYGLTLPLITKADGTKFGKTEGGSIWLDPEKTSVYQFYQFWINTDDRDVPRYLRFFTMLGRDEIDHLEKEHESAPGKREAHRALARVMTTLVHGESAFRAAEKASAILFGGDVDDVNEDTIAVLRSEIPEITVSADQLGGDGLGVIDALVSTKLVASNSQARKDIQGGGVYVNGVRCSDFSARLGSDNLLPGGGILLRKGKRNYALVSKG